MSSANACVRSFDRYSYSLQRHPVGAKVYILTDSLILQVLLKFEIMQTPLQVKIDYKGVCFCDYFP